MKDYREKHLTVACLHEFAAIACYKKGAGRGGTRFRP